jgi:RNA polymerase primary sigma factor
MLGVLVELVARAEGREERCIDLSELSELADEAGISEDDAQLIHDTLDERGFDIRDDCGRGGADETTYVIDELSRQTTDALSLFLHDVRRFPLLTRDEEVELAQQVERGDLGAKDRLINSNLRLVIAHARKAPGNELPLLDLIQEGILGLIRAVEKFDWRKGYRFSTYATFWIRQAIQRALDSRSRTIRIPVELGQRERKIGRVTSALASKLGREPTDREIASAAELDLAEVTETRAVARVVASLDRPLGEGEGTSLGSVIASSDRGPEEELQILLREEALRRAVDRLPEPHRQVVRLRYGINGDEPTPLVETGRRLGVSQDTVRRLERKALSMLATSRELDGLPPAI